MRKGLTFDLSAIPIGARTLKATSCAFARIATCCATAAAVYVTDYLTVSDGLYPYPSAGSPGCEGTRRGG
jgi:hypothetical protein